MAATVQVDDSDGSRRDGDRAGRVARVVGLGALVALALSVVRQSDTFAWSIDPGATAPLVRGFLLGVIAVALLGVIGSRARLVRGARRGRPGAGIGGGGVGLAAVLACLLAAAVLIAVVGVRPDALAAGSTSLSALTGLALGVACALCLLCWTRALVRVTPRELITDAAVATAVAGVALGTFRMARTVPAGVAWLLAAIALEVVALAVCARPVVRPAARPAAPAVWRPDAHTALRCLTAISDTADRIEHRAGQPTRVRDVLAVLWIPLAAVGFCAFVQGLTWDPVASMGDRRDAFALDAASMAAGSLVAAAIALAVTRRRDESASLALLNGVALPIALVVVLLVPVVTRACPTEVVRATGAVASVGGFALLGLIALVDLVVTIAVTRADRTATVASALAGLAALELLGLEAIAVLGESGRDLCLVLEAILLAAIAVTYAMRARGINAGVDAAGGDDVEKVPGVAAAGNVAAGFPGTAPTPSGAADAAAGNVAPEAEDDFRARCLQIARAHGLSPRETDVLQYLARGHSSRFIATELVISENTVRTHVRHIYEKTGVTSREGLFRLVDAPAER
ncbi:helix-turn-helix transcriptional regulator [bacterium]|nr:helix-turn-helix transcriptional regulator [bacterium]